jgi:hypothetical protein
VRARWIGREKEELQFPVASGCSVVTRPLMTTEKLKTAKQQSLFVLHSRWQLCARDG